MAGIEHGTLQAGRYALRPATSASAEAALAMSLDPAVMQWNSTGVRDLSAQPRSPDGGSGRSVSNASSCRTPWRTRPPAGVAARCGYLLEGVQRLGFRDDAGKRWDSHLHAGLAGDRGPILVVS